MLKKIGFPILFGVLAAYLFFYAYSNRSVSAFLWAVSFVLIAWTTFTSFVRGTLVSVISILITFAIIEAALGYLPQLMAKKTANTNVPTAYFDTNFSYATPAYWQLGPFGSQPKPGVFESR